MEGQHVHRIPFSELASDHSLSTIALRLRHAIELVESRTRVNPSARVVRWLGALERLRATPNRVVLARMRPSLKQGNWDHPYKDSFHALVDSRMFIEIIEQLLPDLAVPDLNDLVSGNFDPGEDDPSSRARDREFELFIGAVCRRAGMRIRLSEPDILFEFDGIPHAIAAKRLRSPKQVAKNISKAEVQIVQAGAPGWIVLDVTRLLDPTAVIVTHWKTAQQAADSHVLALTQREQRRIFHQKRNPLVRGIITRTVFPHISEGPRFGSYESWWCTEVPWGDTSATNKVLRYLLPGLDGT